MGCNPTADMARLLHRLTVRSETDTGRNMLVANPRTNTNKLSMCAKGDSRYQPDGFKGSIEFLPQINVVTVQGVEDFG